MNRQREEGKKFLVGKKDTAPIGRTHSECYSTPSSVNLLTEFNWMVVKWVCGYFSKLVPKEGDCEKRGRTLLPKITNKVAVKRMEG